MSVSYTLMVDKLFVVSNLWITPNEPTAYLLP